MADPPVAAVHAWLLPAMVVLGLTLPGCVVRRTIEIAPTATVPRYCADGRPVKILQHPDCTGGICGYTCAPDRWAVAGTH